MNFRLHQHRLYQLTTRLNIMVVMVLGLLATTILLSLSSWYLFLHQRIEITPFMGGEAYQKSDNSVDTHYLSMMSENFLYARLNVTPETVLANHKRLLSFVDSRYYNDFSLQLQKEADLIQQQKMVSHVDVLSIHPNPSTLTTVMTGIIKRSVGYRDLPEEPVTYTLHFRYHLGRLMLTGFTHQSGVAHA